MTTTYVAHVMPWFRNSTQVDGNHWCDPNYGNSYYESVLGRYASADPAVIHKQLSMMKAVGLDGVWIDMQFPDWLEAVNATVEQVTALGMNFAIVIDNYAFADIVDILAEDLKRFMAMPNYYRVYGRSLLPYYEHPERWGPAVLPVWRAHDGHHPFIVGTYSAHSEEEALPAGYDSLFFWLSPDIEWLADYYRSERFDVKVGAIYRGWREAYSDRNHTPPYLGFLDSTLQLARQQQPHFAQLVTWNDYSEGTMLEPSYLRDLAVPGCGDPSHSVWHSQERTCADLFGREPFTDGGRFPPCLPPADPNTPCSGSGAEPCAAVVDCSKPWGVASGPGAAGCEGGGDRSAYAELAVVAEALLGIPREEAIHALEAIAGAIAPPREAHDVVPSLDTSLISLAARSARDGGLLLGLLACALTLRLAA